MSYRNQYNDLLCKSMDWFLFGRDLRHERVKYLEKLDLLEIRSMRRVISEKVFHKITVTVAFLNLIPK